VGFGRQALTPVCGTLRLAARLRNDLGVNNSEQGAPGLGLLGAARLLAGALAAPALPRLREAQRFPAGK
jgi:hypothetical protein